MLVWLHRCCWIACVTCVCSGLSIGTSQVWAQASEPAAESAAPAESTEAAQVETQAPAAAPAAEAPAAEVPAQLDPAVVEQLAKLGLPRLAHPSVADQLELSDDQRASVARLLNERATALAAASPAEQQAVLNQSNQKLAALLTDAQRTALAQMVEPQKLKFNFKGQPWDDVLDWFARQAGLTLVMAKPPEGKFYYTDNRAYTPVEAIDLLNSVLLTQGLTLVRRQNMLVLVNLSGQLPLNMLPQVPPEEIQDHGDSEFIRVMFPIGARPADAVVKELEPLLSNYGKITALPQTKQLLITDTAGNLGKLSVILASIPEPKPPRKPEPKPEPKRPSPVLGVYTATGISTEAAMASLTEMFPNAKFSVDNKADQIFAFAVPNEQEAIDKAVKQMIANDPPDKQARLEIYSLGSADVTQLQEQLAVAAPESQITVDAERRRLLVFGDPEAQKMVGQVLEKLGVTVATGDQHVVVYPVRQVEPQTLAKLIEDLLPEARVTVEERARSVVVSATAGDQTMVKALVEQLEQDEALNRQIQLQVYPLEEPIDATSVAKLQALVPDAEVSQSADARQLMVVARPEDQTRIKSWIDQWQQAMSAVEKPSLKILPLEQKLSASDIATIQQLVPEAKVTLATDGKQLTVVATVDQQEEIAELLTELTAAAASVEEPEFKIFPLEKKLDATAVTTLQTLVPGARVTLATDGKQLTVVATVEQQAEIAKLLTELTAAAAQVEDPEFKIYPLERTLNATAVSTLQRLVPGAQITLATDGRQLTVVAAAEEQAEIETLIQQLVAAEANVQKPQMQIYQLDKPLEATVMTTLQSLAATAKISTSADGRRLVVVAKDEDQQIIQETLEQIKSSAGLSGDRQLEIYQVRGFSAAELQRLLQPVATSSTITVDSQLDRLIVWGPADEHAEFSKVIAKLGADQLAGTKPELRFYSLPSEAMSTNVTTVLSTLAPTAKVTWDAVRKQLMVTAPPREHEVVRQTIDQFTENAPEVEDQQLKLYSLAADDRARFDAIEADVLKDFPGMRVIKNPETNELTVWAQPAQHEEFAKLLDQLKVNGPVTARPVLMGYAIVNGSAETVFEMLQQLYPTAKFSLDKKSQRVLALAPLRDQVRIEATVKQADVEALPENEEQLQSYSFGDMDPTSIMPMLQKLVPDMELSADTKARTIVAAGMARDHAKLVKVLEQFRGGDPSQQPTIKSYPLEGRDRRDLERYRSVLAQLVPDAVLAIDDQGGAIVASARPKEHEQLQEAVQEVLDSSEGSQRELRTYILKRVSREAALGSLSRIYSRAFVFPMSLPDQIGAWASPKDHERIAGTIEQLEKSSIEDGSRELRSHNVDPAVADELTSVIASTLPDLEILSGSGTSKLMVWGLKEDHDRLEKVIQQLESEAGLDQPRELVVYELGDLSPTEARRELEQRVGELEFFTSGAPDRLPIRATAAQHERIQKVLENLKQAVKLPEQILKIHELDDDVDVSAIYSAISTEARKNLTITLDTANNSLTVRGPADRQAVLEKELQMLIEELPKRELPSTRKYAISNPAVATQLTSLLPTVIPELRVLSGQGSDQLLLWGKRKDFDKLDELILDLEKEIGTPQERELVQYDLEDLSQAEAQRILDEEVGGLEYVPSSVTDRLVVRATPEKHELVQVVLEQWKKAVALPEQFIKVHELDEERTAATVYTALSGALGADVMGKLTVQVDTPSNSLIVRGPAPPQQEFAAALQELLLEMPVVEKPVARVYKLERADPTSLRTILSQMFPAVPMAVDTTARTFAATAKPKEHEKIQSVIDQAERKDDGDLEFKVYSLKWANAYAASLTLSRLVPAATVIPDITNKTLNVAATIKDHERVEKFVAETDQRGGGEPVVKTYPLKYASPSYLVTALTQVVPDARITSDPVNKTLIIAASEEDHKILAPVIEDSDRRGGGEAVVKTYPLKYANPGYLTTALAQVAPNALVAMDPYNKMLIVTASEEDHAILKPIIEELDKRGGGDLTYKSYALKWMNPVYLSSSLQTSFPNARITADPTNKMLIVAATDEDHAQIKQVVEDADRRGDGEPIVKTYSLKFANPSYLITALTQVVPNAKITSDPLNKKLIVAASEEDHAVLAPVIEEADQRGGGDAVVKTYPLKYANPSYLTTALAQVVPNALVAMDPYNKMLIVTASEEDHVTVEPIIKELDKRGGGELEFKSYPLKWANPTYLMVSMRPAFPDATFSADAVNKMLIVAASAEDHVKIKKLIDESDKRSGGDPIVEVYPLKFANPSYLVTALTQVVPDAKVTSDPYNKTLVVAASAEDHEIIKPIIESSDLRGGGDPIVKSYSLKYANPTYLISALREVVPDAIVANDPLNKMLIVTASKEDQAIVEPIIQELDKRGGGDLAFKSYQLNWANPTYLMRTLTPMFPDATLNADIGNNVLVVAASEEDHQRIKAVIDETDRRGGSDWTTNVYTFQEASPIAVMSALEDIIPNAEMTADQSTRSLVVHASAEDQQQIEPLIKQLDIADPRDGVLQSYQVENAEVEDVYDALRGLYRYDRDVNIGYQEKTGTILVVAPQREQERVRQAIEDIDDATSNRPDATLEVYSLVGLDGSAVTSALRAVMLKETPKIEIQMDYQNNQILAIAEPDQHQMIRKALEQLRPEQREVEVFTLKQVDPYSAESAIDSLFSDLPYAAAPTIDSDPGTQKLFIRATKEQFVRIRELLTKMGEEAGQEVNAPSSDFMRVIPMSGDVDDTIEQIRRLWPRVRGNSVQVISPLRSTNSDDQGLILPQDTPPPANSPDRSEPADADPKAAEEGSAPAKAAQPPALNSPDNKTSAPKDDEQSEQTPPASGQSPQKSAARDRQLLQFVSVQAEGTAVADDPPATIAETPRPEQPAATSKSTGGAADEIPAESSNALRVENPADAAADSPALPPVVLIPGQGKLTIVSQDKEALDELQRLLEVLGKSRVSSAVSGNFAIYRLQHADAGETANVLQELLRRGAGRNGSSYSRYSRYGRRSSQQVMIVADERMNALLVHGTPTERAVIEDMLPILDAATPPELLSTERPRMIRVKNLPASAVLEVLESVYRTYLTGRRSLKQVTIPAGISPQMTAMLELLNAAADAPLLTLDVDETTNSILLRAPKQLGEEIEEFVHELDQQSVQDTARSVNLIPLQEMNSDQLERTLNSLMRGRGGYGRRSYGRGR